MKKEIKNKEELAENKDILESVVSDKAPSDASCDETEKSADAALSPKKKSWKKRLLFKVCFLALTAAGAGVAVYHITPLVVSVLNAATPIIIEPKETPDLETSLEIWQAPVSEEMPPLFEELAVIQDTPPVTEELPVSEGVLPETQVQVLPAIPEIVPEPKSIPVIPPKIAPKPKAAPVLSTVQPVVTPSEPSAGLSDKFILKALELKDSFKNGNKCRVVLEELIAMPDKTPAVNEALMNLLQVCLEQPKEGKIQEVFARSKKQVILQIFKDEYPLYLAYFKALPYLLADIRQKHPKGDDSMAVLNRIQIAINSEKPMQVLSLIDALPQSVQPYLYDVRQYAEHESALYQTLNNLIQALFSQEEAK